MTRADAIRKTRALLNTAAEGSGATEPERATAKRLAFVLIDAHCLKAHEWGEEPTPKRPKAPQPARPNSVRVTINGVLFDVDLGSVQHNFSSLFTTMRATQTDTTV